MKKFKDLKPGDVIYYYDHFKMRPQVVHSVEEYEEEKTFNGYFGEVHIIKEKKFKMVIGKNRQEYIIDLEASCPDLVWYWKHMFASKEAAEEFLEERRQVARNKIEEAKQKIFKYNRLIFEYDLCE